MPLFDPTLTIIPELKRRLNSTPFEPFTIVTSSGEKYHVPARDHLTITSLFKRILFENDDSLFAQINPLHVTAIQVDPHITNS